MDLQVGYGVRITPSGGSATLIGGVTNQSMPIDTEQNAEATAGSYFAHHGEITRVQPRGLFSSYQVADVIDLLGLTGACLAGGESPGFEMWELALDACGKQKVGATDHRKLVIPNGLVVARSISASHRQPATIACEVMSIYDGTNDPLIITESQPAPTGLSDSFRYTMGPVTIGGQAIEGNLSVEIDLGNGAATDGGDSEPFDTHIQIPQVIPTITISTRDVKKFAESVVPLRGLHGTHANTSIILRRRVNGTASFSDAADSIEITADVMCNFDDVFNAQAASRGQASLRLTALHDGTNSPLVFDTSYDLVP